MRKGLISLTVGAALLLAGPPAAPAQVEQYVAPTLAPEQGTPEQHPGPQPDPASGAGREPTPPAPQQTAQESQTDTQQDTEQSQTDTGPGQDQQQTDEQPQSPEDVPGQYCDPLAEEGCPNNRKSGSKSDEQSGDQQAPVESGAVAPVAAVGSELPSTGAPLGMIALVGSALLGGGAALRRLSRDDCGAREAPRQTSRG